MVRRDTPSSSAAWSSDTLRPIRDSERGKVWSWAIWVDSRSRKAQAVPRPRGRSEACKLLVYMGVCSEGGAGPMAAFGALEAKNLPDDRSSTLQHQHLRAKLPVKLARGT